MTKKKTFKEKFEAFKKREDVQRLIKAGRKLKKESIVAGKEGYKAGVRGVAVTSSALESIETIASKYGKVKLKNRQIVRSGPRAVVNVNQEVAFEDKSRFFDQPQPTSILHSDSSSLSGGSIFSGNSNFFRDEWEKEKKRANVLLWD